ncbi:Na+/H+ antiporter NhaA [Agarilytica rhodophyticola]|uniref:Na+/H+ antiporter NhaA n=1 Tax=Agarilytica rhodophyticola TaxID=1737490 RepID=UPI000CD99FBD|nr:Na+/H+ antiporter NhaA [Agarilytica rhodophyticola]
MEAVKKSRGRHIQIAIDKFFTWAASAAFTLLIATIAALVFSNSGLQETYRKIQQFNFGFVFDKTAFDASTLDS